jgi:hypothetical protein
VTLQIKTKTFDFASDWPDAIGKWQALTIDESLPPMIVFDGQRQINLLLFSAPS